MSPLAFPKKAPPQTQEVLDKLDSLVDEFRHTIDALREQFEQLEIEDKEYKDDGAKSSSDTGRSKRVKQASTSTTRSRNKR